MAGRVFEIAFAIKGVLGGSFKGMTGGAVASLRQMNEKMRELRAKEKELQDAFKSGGMGFNDYASKLREVGQKMRDLQGDMDKTTGHVKRMNELTSKVGARKDRLIATTAVGASMADAITSPIKAAMSFESSMADVKKVVDFDTPEQFKEMEQDILDLSMKIPMTSEEISKLVAAGGQSGIARDELMEFAEAAGKMGIAFDITADEAGDMMAKWRTAFKMGQGQVIELADKINFLGNTTAAKASEISDVVTRVGGLSEVAGLNAGQVAALGASIVGAGYQSEIAATGVKNFILALTQGDSVSDKQYAAFQSLGFEASDLAERMQTDAQGAILDVIAAIKKLPAAEQAATLSTIFGKESIGPISALITNTEELVKNFNRVGDSAQYAESMEKEFAARCSTAENAVQLVENASQYASVTIGQAFLPMLKEAAQELLPLIKSFADWSREHQTLIKVVLVATAALVGFVVVMQAGALIVSSFKLAIEATTWLMAQHSAWARISAAAQTAWGFATSALSGVLGTLRGVMTPIWAMMNANPVGAVILGFTLLIGVGVALYKNWDLVLAKLQELREAFSHPIETAKNFFGFGEAAPEAGGTDTAAVSEAAAKMSEMGSSASEAASKAQALQAALQGSNIEAGDAAAAMDLMNQTMLTMPEASQLAFSGMGSQAEAAVSGASEAMQKMPTITSENMTGVANEINLLAQKSEPGGQAFITAAGSWGEGAYTAVMDWINRLPGDINNAISSAWSGIRAELEAGANLNVNVHTQAVAANASGGIYSKGAFLTTFAEESGEAAIPLDGKPRSVALWREAGRRLGVDATTGGAAVTEAGLRTQTGTAFDAPPIKIELNVYGAESKDTSRQVYKAVEDSSDKLRDVFKDLMENWRREQGRLSYG